MALFQIEHFYVTVWVDFVDCVAWFSACLVVQMEGLYKNRMLTQRPYPDITILILNQLQPPSNMNSSLVRLFRSMNVTQLTQAKTTRVTRVNVTINGHRLKLRIHFKRFTHRLIPLKITYRCPIIRLFLQWNKRWYLIFYTGGQARRHRRHRT